ncbi:MAG: hypothetical protein GXC72_04680 [Chitinophagaceae bacterium]|jgi:hypothetical protein|nr:hypothetical protein [Chitinophagaceae bacterium]
MAAKTYDYIIVLKRRSFKLADGVALLMLLLAIIILLEEAFTPFSMASAFPIAIVALILGFCAFNYAKLKNGRIPFYRVALLVAGWGIIYTVPGPYKWITALYVIAAAIEKQVKFPREIAFDETGIVINSFPRKNLSWQDVANVVLKDGLLTLDLKNNHLIQQELESDISAKLEMDFNDFCKNMLTAERERAGR